MPRAVMRFVARRFTVSQCNVLDALVVPSRAMQQALLDYGVRCPMHIIPDRHGDGALRRRRRRSAFARSSASRRVSPMLVHVGRIAHEKNIDFLFRMFAQVVRSKPDAVLIVAGEGPALASLQGVRATRSGCAQHVRFVGYLSRERELLDCYRAGDLFVFSSQDRDAGPGAARSDGARRAGRVDGAHGNGGHREPAARRARRAGRRRRSSRISSCELLDDRAASRSHVRRGTRVRGDLVGQRDGRPARRTCIRPSLGQAPRNSPVSQPV